MMKRLMTTIAAATIAAAAQGQTGHSLYFMESVPQTTMLNPARQPRANKFIAMPGANAYVAASTNIRPRDFFQKKDGKWLTPLNDGFDYTDLYDSYKRRMAFDSEAAAGLMSFGWRTEDGHYLSFSLSERVSASVALPADLLKIGDRGLPSGTVLDLARLGVNAMAYTELAAAYSRAINEQWTAGVRVKLLAGTGAVRTRNDKMEIRTGEDKWHVRTDIEVMASLPLETDGCIRADGTVEVDSIELREFDTDRDLVKYLIPRAKNPGAALDLGAEYRMGERLRFSASVTDLGFISWGRDINRFRSRGDFDFEGIDYDLDDEEHEKDFQNAVDDCLDSIEARCNVTLSHGRFAMALRPSVYVGAEFTPTYFLNLGLLSHTKIHGSHRVNQDFSVSATLNPYKLPASATVGYTINTRGQGSASFGVAVRVGVVQIYTALDYIPLRYSEYHTADGDDMAIPNNVSNVNVSAGVNFVFGTKGYRDRPMTRTNSRIAE